MKIQYGFTLVEMAVVLVIIGLLIGGFIISLPVQMDIRNIKVTQERLEEIKEALIGFAIINGYLPCPALDENGEAANYETSDKLICKTYDQSDGYLPWIDLGVGRYDGWGNPFRYRVDGKFSNQETGEFSIANPPKNEQALEVRDRGGSSLSSFDPDLPANEGSYVVAIIFSCGKNGRPDPTPPTPGIMIGGKRHSNDADGTRNSDALCTNAVVNRDLYIDDVYVEDHFDDILVWLPKTILINRLVVAGKWP